MISSTQTIQVISLNEAFDKQGVKITYGQCTFSHYSKDGVVEDKVAFRAKGAAAVSIAEAGVGASGVAIGYIDLETIDSGRGYKQKKPTLVIRTFILTSTTKMSSALTPSVPSQEAQNHKELVGAVAAVASKNGYLNIADDSGIPF
jgi:hypothetical protein